MKRERKTEFRVGLVVSAVLIIGGALAFVVGSTQNFFSSKRQFVTHFSQVDGLRDGSPVRIAGVDVGVVTRVALEGDGSILVTLSVVEDAADLIRRDSIATIGNKGLLGDKLLDITVGAGERIPPGGAVASETPVGMGEYLDSAGEIIEEVEQTAETLRIATGPFAEERFSNELRDTTHNLALITRIGADEDGTLARLLSDQDSPERADRVLADAEDASRELVVEARSVRRLVQELETGEGTIHDLIYDDGTAQTVANLAESTGDLAASLREAREGEGMVHQLVFADTGTEDLAELVAASGEMRTAVADIREGRGSLGGLLTDPTIYEDVKRMVGNLERNSILRAVARYSIRQEEAGPSGRDSP